MADPTFYQPPDLQLSKFRFYSAGMVVANKPLSSSVIEVMPVEELTMVNGELNAVDQPVTSQGTDALGQSYQTSTQTNLAIKAKWLKLSSSNRMTAPDVRRGAMVMIYQFGDSDSEYYWTTWQDDSKLRKLETVIWGISATTDEAAVPSSANMYYFEVSSHTKQVTFHTSQANGEAWGYDIQIDADAGYVTIQDTVGNVIRLDSAASRLLMQNVDGTTLDIQQRNMTIVVPDTLSITAKNIITKADVSQEQITQMTTQTSNLQLSATKFDTVSAAMSTTATLYNLSAVTGTSTGSMGFAGESFKVTSTTIDFD